MFLLHMRYATHGSPQNNANNHPHPVDGGWLIHNGVIRNYEQLVTTHKLWPVSECDSEVIGLMAERGESPMAKRFMQSVSRCAGPIAAMGIWNRPAKMAVVRSGNPLSYVETEEGRLFATLPNGLPGKAKNFDDDKLIMYGFNKKGERYGKVLSIPIDTRCALSRNRTGTLFAGRDGQGQEYAGG